MKIIAAYITFILLSSSLFASAKTKIDTIDFWHVFYNKKDIAHYPQYQKNTLQILKKTDIKPNDTLTVKYGNDTPCNDCVTGLNILDKNKKRIVLANGKGTWSPLTISLTDILDAVKLSGHNYLDLYYYDGKRNTFLFRLKLK